MTITPKKLLKKLHQLDATLTEAIIQLAALEYSIEGFCQEDQYAAPVRKVRRNARPAR